MHLSIGTCSFPDYTVAHAEAEAAKDNNNKKRRLADTACSWAKEVAVSILTGDD